MSTTPLGSGPYNCDDGKAKGPFQAWQVACPEPGGSHEWLEYSALCASRRLTGAYHCCKSRNPDPIAGAFSGYGGASCTLGWANKRAARARAFAGRLGA